MATSSNTSIRHKKENWSSQKLEAGSELKILKSTIFEDLQAQDRDNK